MKVFLDTNVFLDMLISRENEKDNENALIILKLSRSGQLEFCISPVTVANSLYCLRKTADSVDRIKSRLETISVEKMDGKDVCFALDSNLPDKEDAMQMSCAVNSDCALILTRDSRHFLNSPLPCFTPAEFLERLR